MPFVNVKLVKDQVRNDKKQQIIEGLTDLIVSVMNRERDLTVIVIDEISPDCWALGGNAVKARDRVSFVNIKVSKGTTHSDEMARMMEKTKALIADILGNHIAENYFIIDELNPAAWGFDGISMTHRSKIEG